jgi:hypothetical protein
MSDEPFTLTSEAAKELSQLGASKGGDARAHKLSAERRSEIARAAVEARWAKAGKKPLPKATHEGTLKIGDIEIQCAVLENGQRLLTQSDFMRALGRARQAKGRQYYKGDVNLPAFLTAQNLKPFISKDLEVTSSQVEFKPLRGNRAFGYPAEIMPKVCDVFWDAEKSGVLTRGQRHIAERAKILTRGLAHVGIIALVDEATGYQDDRAKDALAKILEQFIAKELRPYVKTFPTDFYKEMFRLRQWKWPELPADQRKRPILVGNLTDNVVYDRLAPGVKQRLKELIGRDDSGRLKKKMFQRLTEEVGDPKLKEHLASVVALMKAADDWPGFIKMIDRALPKYKPMPLFDQVSEQP